MTLLIKITLSSVFFSFFLQNQFAFTRRDFDLKNLLSFDIFHLISKDFNSSQIKSKFIYNLAASSEFKIPETKKISSQNSTSKILSSKKLNSSRFSEIKNLELIDISTKNKILFSNIYLQKKWSVFIFLSMSCPCVRLSIKDLKTLNKSMGENFDFIGVNVDFDSNIDQLNSYYKNLNLNFPVFWDPQLKLAKAWDIRLKSETAIFTTEGLNVYQGGIRTEKDDVLLKTVLNDLKLNKKVSISSRQGIGCFIEYSRLNSNINQD